MCQTSVKLIDSLGQESYTVYDALDDNSLTTVIQELNEMDDVTHTVVSNNELTVIDCSTMADNLLETFNVNSRSCKLVEAAFELLDQTGAQKYLEKLTDILNN